MFRIFIVVLMCIVTYTTSGLAIAQEVSDTSLTAANNIFCTDNFSLANLDLRVSGELAEAVPRTVAGFSGVIENQNTLTVTAAELRARVFRVSEGSAPALVDRYVVANNVTLPASGRYPFTDLWTVPATLAGGTYVIEYALSFFGEEAALVGYGPSFVVVSEEESVVFDYDTLTLNGEPYTTFDQTTITDDEPVTLSIEVNNPTDEEKIVPLQWNQYLDSHPVERKRFDTRTSVVTIPANSTETITYTTRETSAKQFLVTGIIDDAGTKSLLSFQFSRADQDPVVLAAGVGALPLRAGEANELFYCIATPTTSDLTSYTMSLTAASLTGETLASISRVDVSDVTIPTFVSPGDFNEVMLAATLEKEGIPIAKSELTLACSLLNPSACHETASTLTPTLFDMITANPLFLYGGAFLLLVLLGVVWLAHRREQAFTYSIKEPDSMTPLVIAFFMLGMSLLPGTATAQLNGFEFPGFDPGGGVWGGPGFMPGLPPPPPPPAGNTPPNQPTVSAPTTGATDGTHGFTVNGTDPDGDQIRYGFDWNNNGTVDQWVPATGYVNSGVTQVTTRQWTTAGTYNYRVLTQDTSGANSLWLNRSITIVDPTPPPPPSPPVPPATPPSGGGTPPPSTPPSGSVSSEDSTTDWIGKVGMQCGFTGTEECPQAINFTVGLGVTGPASVEPGANYTVNATGWCNGDDFSGSVRVGGGIQGGPSFAGTEPIFCPSGTPGAGLPAGSVTLTAPTTPGLHCRTFFVQGIKIPAPFENDYLVQPTVTRQFCVNVDGDATPPPPPSAGSCVGTVVNVESTGEDLYPVDCQSVDQGGNVGLPACSSFSYGAGDQVVNPTDITNGTCIMGPFALGGGRCTYSTVTISENAGSACVVPPSTGPNSCTFTDLEVCTSQDGPPGFVCSTSGFAHTHEVSNGDPSWNFGLTPSIAATFTVGGQTQRYTLNCNGDFSQCSNAGSYTLNGHTFDMAIDSNRTGTPTSGGIIWAVGQINNCTDASGTQPATPTANLTINGSDGPLTVNDTDTLAITWNGANAPSCTLYGAGLPGGTVGLSGNVTVPANVVTASPETYVLNCGGVIDTVVVTVTDTNSAPNPPTIVGPITGDTGVTYPFVFTATDPDGDQIQYEIDWNNDGTTDVPSMLVNSGVGITGNRSWPTAGSYTFQVRARDTSGAVSSWTQHTITLTQSSPATALLEAQVNGTGPWSSADQSINPGDTLALRWSSTGATSCTGTSFNTSGTTGGSVGVTPPAPGNATSYSVTCTGSGGSGSDTITITTRALPNFTRPNVTHTLSTGFDPATGEYDSVTIRFNTSNGSGSPTNTSVSSRLQFDSRPAVSRTIPPLNVGQEWTSNAIVIEDVSFGTHVVTVEVDTPLSSNGVVAESNENDNDFIYNFGGAIPPPDPNLEITANPTLVRTDETTTISWNTNATYPMNCTVSGPAIAPVIAFDPSMDGATGSRVVGPITAKSAFTLECVEPITNTPFIDTVEVEVIGTVEEV